MTAPFIESRLIRGLGAAAGFSTRREERIEAIGRAAEFDPSRLFMVTQVHGKRVVRVGPDDSPEAVRSLEADGLVTSTAGIALAVRTADCVPVLIAAPRARAVAAAHGGWRGIVAGILGEAVAETADAAACEPAELVAAIGPAIGPCCFEVGEEVAEEIAHAVGTKDVVLRPTSAPKPFVDLRRAAELSLLSAGLQPTGIEKVGPCTRCTAELLHSYRRDGPRSGRQLGFVARRAR